MRSLASDWCSRLECKRTLFPLFNDTWIPYALKWDDCNFWFYLFRLDSNIASRAKDEAISIKYTIFECCLSRSVPHNTIVFIIDRSLIGFTEKISLSWNKVWLQSWNVKIKVKRKTKIVVDYISFSVKWLYSKVISPTSFLRYRNVLICEIIYQVSTVKYSNADLRNRSHVGQDIKTCSKSIKETPKQKVKNVHQNDFIWRSGDSIFNFEHLLYLALLFLLLTWNIYLLRINFYVET